ncbi:MAG: hypothetical protein COV67_06170 [Nitrospinae bacterium CG11_big_fil_rev_8_21_14_0_20_56_8]|nr:MAG: hypothetical protein COV67_06170 [Nitrospinae bacterium CG11_big_fil_rev_8_21_14_0_20_56_8]
MKHRGFELAILMALFLWVGACATTASNLLESSPPNLPPADEKLFIQALYLQKEGHIGKAIELWDQFIKKYPRSFEAHNNLGLAYYANDRIQLAASEFESALVLEPRDPTIRDNLKRALKLQATLQTENKEYEKAIQELVRLKGYASPPEAEAIGFEIEVLQDKIFEQVQKAGTLQAYQEFVTKFPNSPQNSDLARKKIEELKMKQAVPPTAPVPAPTALPRPTEGVKEQKPEGFEIMPLEAMKLPSPGEPTVEVLVTPPAETPAPETPLLPPASTVETEPEKPEAPSAVASAESAMTKKIAPAAAGKKKTTGEAAPAKKKKAPPSVKKKVKIATKKDPLLVRDSPRKGKVIHKLDRGTVVTVVGENDGWYEIEFGRGKKGWIAKKFTKPVE